MQDAVTHKRNPSDTCGGTTYQDAFGGHLNVAKPGMITQTISAKRARFAKEYMADHNATQAAIRAGYSEHTAKQQGSRLLTYADVDAEIERLQRERWEAEAVDREYVLRRLQELAETAKSETAQIRALELLGKSLGLFREQVEVHAKHDVSELQQFNLAELLTMRNSLTATEVESRIVDD